MVLGRRRDRQGREDLGRDRALFRFRQRTIERAVEGAIEGAEPRVAALREPGPEDGCEHLRAAPGQEIGPQDTCEDHEDSDGPVVHLRYCLTCGYVGCCDSSLGQHATKHAKASGHPVIQSAEPGETWRWCYPDELLG